MRVLDVNTFMNIKNGAAKRRKKLNRGTYGVILVKKVDDINDIPGACEIKVLRNDIYEITLLEPNHDVESIAKKMNAVGYMAESAWHESLFNV